MEMHLCPNLDFQSGKLCTLVARHDGRCDYARDRPDPPAGTMIVSITGERARVVELELLLAAAERIIVFAVARLDVLTFPGWPYQELRKLANYYKDLRGDQKVDPRTQETIFDPEMQRRRELGQIWLDFAAEAESWEESRRAGTHKQRLQQENLMRAPAALLSHVVPEQTVKKARKAPKKARKSPKKPKK